MRNTLALPFPYEGVVWVDISRHPCPNCTWCMVQVNTLVVVLLLTTGLPATGGRGSIIFLDPPVGMTWDDHVWKQWHGSRFGWNLETSGDGAHAFWRPFWVSRWVRGTWQERPGFQKCLERPNRPLANLCGCSSLCLCVCVYVCSFLCSKVFKQENQSWFIWVFLNQTNSYDIYIYIHIWDGFGFLHDMFTRYPWIFRFSQRFYLPFWEVQQLILDISAQHGLLVEHEPSWSKGQLYTICYYVVVLSSARSMIRMVCVSMRF